MYTPQKRNTRVSLRCPNNTVWEVQKAKLTLDCFHSLNNYHLKKLDKIVYLPKKGCGFKKNCHPLL